MREPLKMKQSAPVVPEPCSDPEELPDIEAAGLGSKPEVLGASGLDSSLNSGAPGKEAVSDISMIRQLLSRKVTWVLVTALTLCLCYALARPVLCSDIEKCQLHHDDAADLIPYSRYIASALSAVLLHELVSVILTHRTAKKAIHLIPNIRESLLPSALLCTTFAVLLAENAAFLIGDTAWFAHAASVGDADLDGLPVYSVFYAEWLINVPILLILAGTCALGRPAPEVSEPLVITNVYMILAWCANFISSTPVRYCVVCVPWLLLAVSFRECTSRGLVQQAEIKLETTCNELRQQRHLSSCTSGLLAT